MKLVWLINTMLPQIAEVQGKEKEVIGGWTVQLADMLADNSEIEFTVFYPQHSTKDTVVGNAGNIRYVGFYENRIPELEYNPGMTERIKIELDKIKPDIVHIWGTEFIHTLSMVRAYNNPDRTIISIQGLIYYWGLAYDADLTERIVKRHTFRDYIRQDSIAQQKEKFLKRGECELQALKEVKHVIGRTNWDKTTVLSVNRDLVYHHAGEILRKEFYDAKASWRVDKAQKNRLFMSQSYYPIKGIHFVLKALYKVKETYPDIKLAVSGKDMRPKTMKEKIKQDSYGKYICELISEYDLDENMEFLGSLTADKMVEEYRKCSAFLLPSVMENSSNSLGEAMMIGVPCIAACTGGTPDMIEDNEGWLYSYNDVHGLIDSIIYVFRLIEENSKYNSELNSITTRAIDHASVCYDTHSNLSSYMKIYNEIN